MKGGHGIDSFAAVQEEVVGSYEHSDELLGAVIKCGEHLDQLLKKDISACFFFF